MKKKQLILSGIVAIVLIALILWVRQRVPFDFGVFRTQISQADWSRIAEALACIYAGYIIRSVRWALLMRHNRKVGLLSLLGTQVIGFTSIALIGRVADLVRPYLVAKKTQTAISAQVAVYIVERLSDAGAMALIFSAIILLSPPSALVHPEIVRKAGYWGLAATMAGALFLVAIRFAGGVLASIFERALGVVSQKLARGIGDKIRTFQTGLDTIRSFADFAMLTSLSIVMWLLIAGAYLLTTLAFVNSPQLAAMTPGKSVLLMAVSGGASVVQLPIIGWFTQIGIVAATIHTTIGASAEASTACAATLLLVTFLGIVPLGLIWAQLEKVNLRSVTEESGHAGEELKAQETPDAAQ
ncbi:lysylphosphatidylglycerol synthase transmembrane domain-containing protein [Terracidiphilus gabretensis]|uniref:lysylphosphatidylglycerol synthase transmembrane domain-containing protein n=1 Tax=Terracidiphilus gabretensis TaxID=1577687 RepID=UPI000AF9D9FA|nr:lysylphosphatidylglycerol synthase transmembrane domain-containing protein [Terracidiphilus gabretensis]